MTQSELSVELGQKIVYRCELQACRKVSRKPCRWMGEAWVCSEHWVQEAKQ